MNKRSEIIETLSHSFEQFAFMFLDFEEEEDEFEFISSYIGASIVFNGGGYSGDIKLYLPEELTYELAANVLGSESENIQKAQAHDGIKELINIICGDLPVRFFGDQNIYNLSIPESVEIPEDEIEEISLNENAINFLVDDEPCVIIVNITPS